MTSTDQDGDVARGSVDDGTLSVEFLASIIDHVGHPIFVKDREFRFVLLNRALCEMVGYPREQMLGKTDYDFFPATEADFFRRKDKEMFCTESRIMIAEESITDAQNQKHVLATTKVPLRNNAGQVTHLIGIIHDITRIKEAEEALRLTNEELERRVADRTAQLEATQEELLRRERLAVLGQLSGGLAHQIRNPLAAITNAVSILRRSLHLDVESAAMRAVRIIEEEAWQANRIITDLLEYARIRPGYRRQVDMREVLEHVLAVSDVPPHITILKELPPLPAVVIDEDQLRGALGNLIRNAVEAMGEGGTLSVRTRVEGKLLVLTISDTGTGIPVEAFSRLFEPLVTTKPLGFGLGLATAKALIDNQGGSIRCSSQPEAPASFEVRLPLADTEVSS